MKKVVIIIPIYKEKISKSEQTSLIQCMKVLGKYPIIFVGPRSLNTNFYEYLCKNKNISFQIKRFKDEYFKGLAEYSRLLLNKDFYKTFKSRIWRSNNQTLWKQN